MMYQVFTNILCLLHCVPLFMSAGCVSTSRTCVQVYGIAALRILLLTFITPHAQRERGKVIGLGVLVYIYICLWTKKNLNRTLAIDLTFKHSR